MKWMKRTTLALAAVAATSFAAVAPGTAMPVGQAAITTADRAALSDRLLTDVGWRGHRGWRHHHHHHGFRGWWIPFVAAPLLYGAYSHGYGDSCYSECRAFHGPGYCRYNWRSYC